MVTTRLRMLACTAIAFIAFGCGGGTSTSNVATSDTKTQANEILSKMTEKIKATPAFSFTTSEQADRRKRGGAMVKMNVTRNVTFKSPDRMYFKVTGDNDLEAYYDGKDLTIVTHKDKVWGKLTAPATIARQRSSRGL